MNWPQAEHYYQQALDIKIEFDDRSQASTYRQLGRVAEEQRQWESADERYLGAMKTYVEADDTHNLAIV